MPGMVLLMVLAGGQLLYAATAAAEEATGAVPSAGNANLVAILKPIRASHGLPAITGAIITSDGLLLQAVVGWRQRDQAVAASLDDKWHIGSCAKAMTATVAARLIERGEVGWDTPLKDIFTGSNRIRGLHPQASEISLRQLLTHTGGLPLSVPNNKTIHDKLRRQHRDTTKQRQLLLELCLNTAPEAAVGTYSNLGYMVAGAALEHLTQTNWEQLIATELCAPLGMNEVGFGQTNTPQKIDQPVGHRADGSVHTGPGADNPAMMAPAGTLHLPIKDWATFAAEHLLGHNGESSYLPQTAFQIMHGRGDDPYSALGWVTFERDWAGGLAISHSGTNMFHYALIWLAPHNDVGFLVATNQGDAHEACDAAAQAMHELWLQGKE